MKDPVCKEHKTPKPCMICQRFGNQMKKLNVGCGEKPMNGYVNLDVCKFKGVDVVHNLDKFPYPFKDNTFDEIRAEQVIEHVNKFPEVMRELCRILKPNGVLKIWSVTAHTIWVQPFHKRAFMHNTMDFFCNYPTEHGTYDFKAVRVKKYIFGKRWTFWNYLIEPIMNKIPTAYECSFLYYLFPARETYFELVK